MVATVTNPPDATATASCPGTTSVPCTVVSRTTAIQEQVGNKRTPFKITTAGRLVGWEITLSAPSSSQIKYFDEREGGDSEASIAIIRQVKGLDYKLEYQGPTVRLQPYFGHTATFPLPTSVPINPGDVVALTVPTWAPALELSAGAKAAWRASRGPGRCTNVTTQSAQSFAGGVAEYYCIYRTALVAYGAVEISTP
ncbi:MAG TPA: hypothetical protein VGG41_17250 [Solirubrobacteraceae bacterium]